MQTRSRYFDVLGSLPRVWEREWNTLKLHQVKEILMPVLCVIQSVEEMGDTIDILTFWKQEAPYRQTGPPTPLEFKLRIGKRARKQTKQTKTIVRCIHLMDIGLSHLQLQNCSIYCTLSFMIQARFQQ